MEQNGADLLSAAIETRIRELVIRERALTFTTLAAALSDCRWISLLRALNRLEQQQVISLTPLPWDYQISVRTE